MIFGEFIAIFGKSIVGRGTPWKINMEPTITHLETKMIFQTSMIVFHVNLPGCIGSFFLGSTA